MKKLASLIAFTSLLSFALPAVAAEAPKKENLKKGFFNWGAPKNETSSAKITPQANTVQPPQLAQGGNQPIAYQPPPTFTPPAKFSLPSKAVLPQAYTKPYVPVQQARYTPVTIPTAPSRLIPNLPMVPKIVRRLDVDGKPISEE